MRFVGAEVVRYTFFGRTCEIFNNAHILCIENTKHFFIHLGPTANRLFCVFIVEFCNQAATECFGIIIEGIGINCFSAGL